MAINHFIDEFMGRPVRQYDPAAGLVEPAKVAWRLGPNRDRRRVSFDAQFAALLADPRLSELEQLVIGAWSDEMYDNNGANLVAALLAAAPKLTALRGVFYGDITYDICEISWIQHIDLGPMVSALPALEELVIRGGNGLRLTGLRCDTLRKLTLQAGGLSGEVVREVVSAQLPNLEHLELWLGTSDYGGSSTVDDLQPLLSGKAFPKLTSLGLKNNEDADELAAAMATAPVTATLNTLDMSMGTMTDRGAEHLVGCPAIAALKVLDVSENYLSPAMGERLGANASGEVRSWTDKEVEEYDEEEDEEDEGYRYVTCGE